MIRRYLAGRPLVDRRQFRQLAARASGPLGIALVSSALGRDFRPEAVGERDDRVLRFVVSDEATNRYGDVDRQNWILENYELNPVWLWAHDMSLCDSKPAIGHVVQDEAGKLRWWTEKRKDLLTTYAEVRFDGATERDNLAEMVYRKYLRGTLRACSIGFAPLEQAPLEETAPGDWYDGPWEVLQGEMLEVSSCNIPANPGALLEELAHFGADRELVAWAEESRAASPADAGLLRLLDTLGRSGRSTFDLSEIQTLASGGVLATPPAVPQPITLSALLGAGSN